MYIYYKLIYSHWYVSLVSYHTSNTQAIFYIGAAATSQITTEFDSRRAVVQRI